MNEPNINSGPTGPRTEAGKATSSKNALRYGLYAGVDLILSEEEADAYKLMRLDMWKALAPEGILEDLFAAEAVTAAWRLRRCRTIELTLSGFDGKPQDQIEKEQKSVDRARVQANNLLRRSMAEIRRLQTEEAMRAQLRTRGLMFSDQPGLIDCRVFVSTLRNWTKACVESANAPLPPNESATASKPEPSSFCKPAAAPQADPKATPRNAFCPCKSGEKFKRCCGKTAPPVLGRAA